MARFDYNLLSVFAILMQERSVTGAAARLGLTQASTSNALARLRSAFGDRLLEREGNAMVPTLRARTLWDELRGPLEVVERSIHAADFDPRSFEGQLRLGLADYVLELFGAQITAAIQEEAPGVKVSLLLSDPPADPEALFSASFDVVVGPNWRLVSGLAHELLFEEQFVGMVDGAHPFASSPPGLGDFLAFPHLLVSSLGFVPGRIDAALRQAGQERVVAVTAPYFASLPRLLKGTDRVVSIGRRLAQAYAACHPVKLFDLPFAADPFAIVLAWHPRNSSSLQHRWLRETIKRVCCPMEPR